MISRKELKRNGRKLVKTHYWHVIAICFLMAFIADEYSNNGTLTLVETYNSANEKEVVASGRRSGGEDSSDILEDSLESAGIVVGEGKVTGTKYNRGVFASVFNNVVSSGSVVYGLLNMVNQGIFHGRLVYGLLLGLGVLLLGLFWFFVTNMLKVGQSRFFMEAVQYEKTSARRMLFLVSIHRWVRACMVMFVKSLYHMLWSLTIVGGVIKSFSYRMVPYIVAENPNVSAKEAITLSRKMMKGHKWEAFVFDLSFLGWELLGLVSFGLVSIFYVNPYQTASKTEYYFAIRELAIKNKIAHYELLNDVYLTRKPATAEGQEDGVTQYPVELFTIPEGTHRKLIHVDYMRKYTIWSLILLFIIFSFVGWCWEVSLHLSTEGFVNRGVLQGPWLPIYGSGGVLVLVLLKPFRQKPWLTFLLTVVVCGCLEYYTSWYLETFKGHKWWDYSGYFLNLNGRICGEGLLVFGLGGCAFIYLFAPLLDNLIQKIPLKIQIVLCVILMGLFIADEAYSAKHPNTGKGITSYAYYQDDLQENKKRSVLISNYI